MAAVSDEPPRSDPAVRVLLVDDAADIRTIVRLTLELDGRYEVVGEAADGIDGVEAAETLQPDIVLLDRSMPRMDGLTALPRIRAVAPDATVILYTSEADADVYQAAVAAGAADVIEKGATVTHLGALVADALVRSAAGGGGDLSVRVGPVPSASALDWIANTTRILEVLRSAPRATDEPIDDDVYATFCDYLALWKQIAEANAQFFWAARASADEVERLVGAWASIDRIDEDRLHELGCEWSSPLGRVFFDAVTTAVMGALESHERTVALARRLEPQWNSPPEAGSA